MFEARQEMQVQMQMQTMMAQMWSHLDLTSQAALSQVRPQTQTRMDPLPEAVPPVLPDEFDTSWEMETEGVGEETPPQQR